MFKISREQMTQFAVRREELYEDRVIGFLKDNFTNAEEESVESLKPPVRELIQRAKSYGLVTEFQGCVFVVAAWIFGINFDTQFPAATEVLQHPEMPEQEKAEWLMVWTQTMLDTLTGSSS